MDKTLYDWKNCWAQSYCKGYNEKCGELCYGYVQLNNIYTLSNMPKRYQKDVFLKNPGRDLDAYLFLKRFQEDVVNQVESGNGLFLYSSNKGNGKTAWTCKIMNEYFRHVAITNNLRCRGYFVNVPTLLQDIRNTFDNPNPKMMEVFDNLLNADIVIWDDIGTENPSHFVRERLYSFINHRYSNNLCQLFTSNLSLETLNDERYIGERIVSRIVGSCTAIEFFEGDRRLSNG